MSKMARPLIKRTSSRKAPVVVPAPEVKPVLENDRSVVRRGSGTELTLVAILLSVLFLWVFSSKLIQLVETWNREPDYSHGFLVPPIAALFLWFRRDRFPRERTVPGWGGFALIAFGLMMSIAGRHYFLNPLLFWSMIAWIGGAVWIVGGRQVFWWAFPSIAFLIFMIPLPYRMEDFLAGPLQRIATYLSCWALQVLGQPAFAEGNTIFLNMTQLEVEHACSGLRMLMMIVALATACAVLVCRDTAERMFLVFCIVPVALFANCVRIVSTGLASQYLSEDASKTMSHDVAGWIVVPVAALLMGLALCYWRRLFVRTEQVLLLAPRDKLTLRHGGSLSKSIP
jgi:exosortase